ncbi:folylpolyglutamate synthase [Lignoscripta atroalba]|nr:folylpolyglutamate synthase [Lignoscripta atroalba]
MLELGLARIGRLLSSPTFSWKAIHVAGTNGKGSVCAYVSAMLQSGNITCGRFTSPHLIDRWDCITINEKVVDEKVFRQVESRIIARDRKESIKATEFELLTATAFEIFAQEKVVIGVVEVGLGGRLDATNVLRQPLVTVITKIGKDHESFLGNSLEEIAYQKAGIMKEGVPCIVDGTNPITVLKVLEDYALQSKAGPLTRVPDGPDQVVHQVWDVIPRDDFEYHQKINVYLAFEAVKHTLQNTHPSMDPLSLLPAVRSTVWPGRLQTLNIKPLTGRENNMLLDGAHNPQSAVVLGSYVDSKLRKGQPPVTWVIAASKGKDLTTMLPLLIRSGDNVAAVEFGPVEGMPWVQATAAEEVLRVACAVRDLQKVYCASGNVDEALRWASETSNNGPLVVAGSLYLVSDVLRLLRYAEN